MTFFRRIKILFLVICPLFVITAVFSGIQLIGADFYHLFSSPEEHFFEWLLFGTCFVLGLASLCLYCIRKDAKEDLTAAFNYAKSEKGDER